MNFKITILKMATTPNVPRLLSFMISRDRFAKVGTEQPVHSVPESVQMKRPGNYDHKQYGLKISQHGRPDMKTETVTIRHEDAQKHAYSRIKRHGTGKIFLRRA